MTGGSIKSEPNFSPSIEAEFAGTGNDFIHNDPDGKAMRLDAHGAVRDKSGAAVYLHYTGVVNITPELGLILTESPEAKSTEFGDSFIDMKFETGDERLKTLEMGTFVGAGRFVVEKGKPVVVEYKVSKVIKGS
ncbi:hypothetical protein ACLMJK_004243 [Lecanora helva]